MLVCGLFLHTASAQALQCPFSSFGWDLVFILLRLFVQVFYIYLYLKNTVWGLGFLMGFFVWLVLGFLVCLVVFKRESSINKY